MFQNELEILVLSFVMKFCGVGTVFTTLEYRQGKQQKIVKPHSSTAEALFSVEYPHCLSSLILKKKSTVSTVRTIDKLHTNHFRIGVKYNCVAPNTAIGISL